MLESRYIQNGYFTDVNSPYNIYFFSEVTFIKADRQYAVVNAFDGGKITIPLPLKTVISLMNAMHFLRTQESYYSNMRLVDHLEKQTDDYAGRWILFKNGNKAKCSKEMVTFFNMYLERMRVLDHFFKIYSIVNETDLNILIQSQLFWKENGRPGK